MTCFDLKGFKQNFFSNHDFFYKISSHLWYTYRKEQESQFLISAPAPAGILISAPRLSAPNSQHL